MIEKTAGYKTSSGKIFYSLEDAQKEEIVCLQAGAPEDGSRNPEMERNAHWIVTNKAKILDILTTNKNSRPKARAVNGGTKRREKTSQAVAA